MYLLTRWHAEKRRQQTGLVVVRRNIQQLPRLDQPEYFCYTLTHFMKIRRLPCSKSQRSEEPTVAAQGGEFRLERHKILLQPSESVGNQQTTSTNSEALLSVQAKSLSFDLLHQWDTKQFLEPSLANLQQRPPCPSMQAMMRKCHNT